MSLLETNSISNKIKWYFAIKVKEMGGGIALLNFVHYLHLKWGKLYPFVQRSGVYTFKHMHTNACAQ